MSNSITDILDLRMRALWDKNKRGGVIMEWKKREHFFDQT